MKRRFGKIKRRFLQIKRRFFGKNWRFFSERLALSISGLREYAKKNGVFSKKIAVFFRKIFVFFWWFQTWLFPKEDLLLSGVLSSAAKAFRPVFFVKAADCNAFWGRCVYECFFVDKDSDVVGAASGNIVEENQVAFPHRLKRFGGLAGFFHVLGASPHAHTKDLFRAKSAHT